MNNRRADLEFMPNIGMSNLQRRVLGALASKKGNIVRHGELLSIWPNQSRTALNMVLFGLRRKVRKAGYQIISHRGLGYSLVKATGEEL